MKLHKITYIVPSDKRHELEKMIEELMDGVEGFKHYGSFDYDPNKPQVIWRTSKKSPAVNGDATQPQQQKRRNTAVEILDILRRDPRLYTTVELSQRLHISNPAVSQAVNGLVKDGKVKAIARGIYRIA